MTFTQMLERYVGQGMALVGAIRRPVQGGERIQLSYIRVLGDGRLRNVTVKVQCRTTPTRRAQKGGFLTGEVLEYVGYSTYGGIGVTPKPHFFSIDMLRDKPKGTAFWTAAYKELDKLCYMEELSTEYSHNYYAKGVGEWERLSTTSSPA